MSYREPCATSSVTDDATHHNGAGGGTRTLKLSRAPAPKAGMFANFITPAGLAILSLRLPPTLPVVQPSLASVTVERLWRVVSGAVRGSSAPHRRRSK